MIMLSKHWSDRLEGLAELKFYQRPPAGLCDELPAERRQCAWPGCITRLAAANRQPPHGYCYVHQHQSVDTVSSEISRPKSPTVREVARTLDQFTVEAILPNVSVRKATVLHVLALMRKAGDIELVETAEGGPGVEGAVYRWAK